MGAFPKFFGGSVPSSTLISSQHAFNRKSQTTVRLASLTHAKIQTNWFQNVYTPDLKTSQGLEKRHYNLMDSS